MYREPALTKSVSYYISRKPGIDNRYLVHRNGCPFLRPGHMKLFAGPFSSGGRIRIRRQHVSSPVRFCPFCCTGRVEMFAKGINKEQDPVAGFCSVSDIVSFVDAMFCSAN